jgi:hypothetical protein
VQLPSATCAGRCGGYFSRLQWPRLLTAQTVHALRPCLHICTVEVIRHLSKVLGKYVSVFFKFSAPLAHF